MKFKTYQVIAQKLNWNPNVQEIIDQRESELDALESLLPHGSGIDCGSRIARDNFSDSQFIIDADYHYMDDNGYYAGWFTFQITITACLQWGYEIDFQITSNDTDETTEYLDDMLGDYIVETYRYAMDQVIDRYTLVKG